MKFRGKHLLPTSAFRFSFQGNILATDCLA